MPPAPHALSAAAPAPWAPAGIKVSYSYPNQYKLAHQEEMLAAFSEEVLASFTEQQAPAAADAADAAADEAGASPREPFQPVSSQETGLADEEAGAAQGAA
jgi:hypothetical protein